MFVKIGPKIKRNVIIRYEMKHNLVGVVQKVRANETKKEDMHVICIEVCTNIFL